MEKIVQNPIKIDLHIHSKFSYHKDGKLVSNNSLENIKVLVDGLTEKQVNVCSITDHDVFSFDMYKALKGNENIDSLRKVLPGIEFSVQFEKEGLSKKDSVHVIAIFDDKDESLVKRIENIVSSKDEQGSLVPRYDLVNKFSEKKFIEILREIGLDVILIAHQKSSPTGRNFTKGDLLKIGNLSNELLFTCYFDALEFKNRNNEIFNNSFLVQKDLVRKIGFITGSDCHDWKYYPCVNAKEKEQTDGEMLFTFAKCLPTFRGLKMCFTDYDRISYENNFFSWNNFGIEALEVTINERNYPIPMSKGINVIIGDNSIGKSLFLYETLSDEFKDRLSKNKKTGYQNYLTKNKMKISEKISNENVFVFDEQGEIRNKFEKGNFKSDKFLSSFFPSEVDVTAYLKQLNTEKNILLKHLKDSEANFQNKKSLSKIKFEFPTEGTVSFNLSKVVDRESKAEQYRKNTDWISSAIITLENKGDASFDDKELQEIDHAMIPYLKKMHKKYEKLLETEKLFDEIHACYDTKITSLRQQLSVNGTKYQQVISGINDQLSEFKETAIKLITYKNKYVKYCPSIKYTEIKPTYNKNKKYNFVNKTNIEKIDADYFFSTYTKLFKKDSFIHPSDSNYDSLKNNLLRFDANKDIIEFIDEALSKKFETDLECIQIINDSDDEEIKNVLSSGMNQRMYFEILSNEVIKTGIYVIDQPEDGVAQKAINEYVLDNFKIMSSNRQIIMVTHNPQFIVNLDVDNVIFIGRNENTGELFVQSGALEYECDDYTILNLISDNIEGGIETLKKRWRRYGKND